MLPAPIHERYHTLEKKSKEITGIIEAMYASSIIWRNSETSGDLVM
jgi:hypothetical protein